MTYQHVGNVQTLFNSRQNSFHKMFDSESDTKQFQTILETILIIFKQLLNNYKQLKTIVETIANN